ncbi:MULTISPECIES: hypothetical protein [Acinetobacter]|nr:MULTISPECIES: hypothetical protein [Acinetobacter]
MMQLIEIEPHRWELYKDDARMYLNVIIDLRVAEYEKTIVLDEEAIQSYLKNGRAFIDALAKRIESSQHRKDYERFYSYANVSKEQKKEMSDAFQCWIATLDEPYSPYV